MTAKSRILDDRKKLVIETIRMRLTEKQSLAYLKEMGFEISPKTYYNDKRKVESLKLKRLFHIAEIGFEDQHLERIDIYEMGFKMMWENVLLEEDPYKCNQMIKDILLLQPYLSSYYEATKLIIDKQQPKYQKFLDKQLEQQQEQRWQLQENEEEENNGDSYSKDQQQDSTKAIPTKKEFRKIDGRSSTIQRTESTTDDDDKNRKF